MLGMTLGWAAGAACAPQAGPEVEPRMIGHYENVGRLYGAAAAGNLQGVHAEANELLARESGAGLPSGAASHVEELRAFASLAARAPDIRSAASATARTGAACGACHRDMKRGPAYKLVSGPPTGATPVASRMIRHQWAADRLWDGLVGPSDESWRAGAGVLRDAPLFTDELTRDVEQYESVTALAWKVHEIGARANTASGQAARAELYSDLLGACATCHGLLREAAQ